MVFVLLSFWIVLGLIWLFWLLSFAVYMAWKMVAMLTIVLSHPYLFNKFVELDIGESFYKPISDHLFSRVIQEFDFFWSYLISNIVMLDINIFYSWVEDWIVSQSYKPLFVTFYWDDNFVFFLRLLLFSNASFPRSILKSTWIVWALLFCSMTFMKASWLSV